MSQPNKAKCPDCNDSTFLGVGACGHFNRPVVSEEPKRETLDKHINNLVRDYGDALKELSKSDTSDEQIFEMLIETIADHGCAADDETIRVVDSSTKRFLALIEKSNQESYKRGFVDGSLTKETEV